MNTRGFLIAVVLVLGAAAVANALPVRMGPSPEMMTSFGTGKSQGTLTNVEQTLFSYNVSETGTHGVITHFWITGRCPMTDSSKNNAIDNVQVRYYIDAEKAMEFTPSFASGVGFDDDSAAWGNEYFGKGADSGAWFSKIRIPFYNSLKVTLAMPNAPHYPASCTYWAIVRGNENLPIHVGDVEIPMPGSQMKLYKHNKMNLNPLEYISLATVPSNFHGLVFLTTMSVRSSNLNFLEGCLRAYGLANYGDKFPGLLLSTGTEDYFDSAFYFDAGTFHLENAGNTHLQKDTGNIEWSAYRSHVMDPIVFQNGMSLVWRNGDTVDPKTGLKCTLQDGGEKAGNPQMSVLSSYVWVYTWK